MITKVDYISQIGGDRVDPQSPLPINPSTDYTASQLNAAFLATAAMTNITPSAVYLISGISVWAKKLTFTEVTPATDLSIIIVDGCLVRQMTITKNCIALDGKTSISFEPVYAKAYITGAPVSSLASAWLAPRAYITNNTSTSFVVNVYIPLITSGTLSDATFPSFINIEVF